MAQSLESPAMQSQRQGANMGFFPKSRRNLLSRAVAAAFFLLGVDAFAEPAMWVIRDKDSTIYLVGTVHLLRHDVQWNTPKLKKALADSQELWLELADADDQTQVQRLIGQFGIDQKKPLSEKLNFVQKAKLRKAADEYNISAPTIEPLKPWAAAMLFTVLPMQKAGLDPNNGVDQVLKKAADEKHETVRGFETAEAQVRFFANMNESDQIAFLEDTLDDVEKGVAQLDELLKAWMDGDSKKISALINEDIRMKSPTLYQTLLVRRNARWAEKIEEILQGSGVQLVAVGAGHLVGPDSVQVRLLEHGIKAESY